MWRYLLLLLLLTGVTAALQAQDKGYKIVRPDGTVEFTDQPVPGAQEITLPKAQSYEAPALLPSPAAVTPAAPKELSYSQLTIEEPAPDETVHNGETPVSVRVHLEPALQAGHGLVILLDGREVAGGTGITFTLPAVERGTHSVIAEVRDEQGKVLLRSAPVTFHQRQHSILFNKPATPTP